MPEKPAGFLHVGHVGHVVADPAPTPQEQEQEQEQEPGDGTLAVKVSL
ncbi:hypothetical protein [Streptomyces sp. NPDC005283]